MAQRMKGRLPAISSAKWNAVQYFSDTPNKKTHPSKAASRSKG
jgi:hypothetical protein